MKKVLVGFVAAAAFTPLFTSADVIGDLQAQIQSLLAQITQLQQQIQQSSVSTVTPTASTPPVCPQLTRTIGRGARGADVTGLQNFLITQNYLSADSATSFFGPLTESALQRWQSAQGVVSSGGAATTGWGAVGPRTRAAIAQRCGSVITPLNTCPYITQAPGTCNGTWQNTYDSRGCQSGWQCIARENNTLSITGLDAPSSLTVGQSGTWTVHASVPGGGQVSYSVVWGDEQVVPMLSSAASSVAVNTSGSFTHTYSQAGTYNPTFTVSNGSGSAQTSASVQVGGSQTSTFSASPTSGPAPLTVTFTAKNGSRIDYGDGSEQRFPMVALGSDPFVYSHTYGAPGTYTAIHYGNGTEINKITITVTGAQNATFSASPTSGTAPLSVTFSGTVQSVYFGGVKINYGDGSVLVSVCDPGTACSFNNIHTYATAGDYTALLVGVGEGPGSGTTIGTVTITVSGSCPAGASLQQICPTSGAGSCAWGCASTGVPAQGSGSSTI